MFMQSIEHLNTGRQAVSEVTLSDPPGGYVDALASVAREACIVRRS